MSPARKFAIAGNVGARVLYWTGGKRVAWTTLERAAKTWRSDSVAAAWLPRVPVDAGVMRLRVLEVAP